jgi:hypothetical protein
MMNTRHSSKQFSLNLLERAPFKILKIQTDNGTEWTNALLVTKSTHKTLFEQAPIDLGIYYHRIRIATPRHNGRVERQHRTDQMRFYDHLRFCGLGRAQMAEYQRRSNTRDYEAFSKPIEYRRELYYNVEKAIGDAGLCHMEGNR